MSDRLLRRHVAKVSGSVIAIWRTGDTWALVCETHSHAIAPESQYEAYAWASQSHEWCPGCKRL